MDGKTVGQIATLFFIVGGFAIFVSQMPSEFYSSAFNLPEYPIFFDPSEILNLKYYVSMNKTAVYPDLGTIFDFTDQDINFKFLCHFYSAGPTYYHLHFGHVTAELGGIPIDSHYMYFFYEPDKVPTLTKETALEYWDVNRNVTEIYPLYCSDIKLYCFIRDPNSTRNDLEDAWDEGTIEITLAFGANDVEAKWTAWDLISRILTFQAPEFFPEGPVGFILNALIALPILAACVALIVIIVLELIPF